MTRRYTAEEALAMVLASESSSTEEDTSSDDDGGGEGAYVPTLDTDPSDSTEDEEMETEMWESRLSLLFNPGEGVRVDEQLVPYRGRCPFRQHIPNKPAKYGIKIWVACDVTTSYAWRMQVYTGRAAGAPGEVNQGQRVVLELPGGLRGKTKTCDNFFTSYRLADELLRRKNALVGTIRRNKPELPPQLLQMKQRVVLSSLSASTQTHTAVSYVPKRGRNVLLLSAKLREGVVSTEPHRKPVVILDYNHCKGGVDNLDKMHLTISNPERRTKAGWGKVLSKKNGKVTNKKTTVNPRVSVLLRRLMDFEWEYI